VTEQGAARRTMRRNIRELPRPAWFLITGSFINRFAGFAVIFLILYLTKLGYSIARAGVVVAAYGFGEVVAAGLGGYLADRLGRRTTIAISMFSSAATILAIYEIHSYNGLVAVAFLAGLASETYRPAGGALLADLVPEGQRVTAFAMLRFAVNLGFALGGAVAGFLASHAFLWLFLTDAATSVAYGVIALTALPEGRRTGARERMERTGYMTALADRVFVLFLMASILIAFVYFQQQATLPLYVRLQGLSFADFGLLLSLNGALVVLLELPLSAITMRLPARQMIAAGFLLVGVGFGLTAVAHTLPMLALTVVIWTAGEMVGAPVGYAYVADIAPEHMRGRYQGLYGLCWASGTVTGPGIGTFLFARGATRLWVLCGDIGVLSAALSLMGRQRRVVPALEVIPAGPDIPIIEIPDVEREGRTS
jgi:MFS family permease